MELTKWDIYYAGLVAMTLHPGYNKPNTPKPSLQELAKIADLMVEESKCRG